MGVILTTYPSAGMILQVVILHMDANFESIFSGDLGTTYPQLDPSAMEKTSPSFFPLTEQWIDPTAREIKVGWVMGGGSRWWRFMVVILLMEEIPNNHLGCIKPCKYWDIFHINWCRIFSINRILLRGGSVKYHGEFHPKESWIFLLVGSKSHGKNCWYSVRI